MFSRPEVRRRLPPDRARQRPTLAIRFVIGKSYFIMLNVGSAAGQAAAASRHGFFGSHFFAVLDAGGRLLSALAVIDIIVALRHVASRE